MHIIWSPQRNGRSPNVSILHVRDYITKRNLSTQYQHRKWNWRWLRLGEAAGIISKGEEQTYSNDRASKPITLGWKKRACDISYTYYFTPYHQLYRWFTAQCHEYF